MRLWTSKQGGTRRRSTPVKIRHQTLRKSRRHLFVPSPQKIVPSPRKFTEDPLYDVQEPSERSRHTCGTSLESSMLRWTRSRKRLNRKLRGHYEYYGYYGRSTNFRCLLEFSGRVRRIWQKWLNRRSRGSTLPGPAYQQLLRRVTMRLYLLVWFHRTP